MSKDLQRQLILSTRNTLVEKIYDPESNTYKKVCDFNRNPNFYFYVSNEDQEVYQTAVPISSTTKIECKFNDRFKVIAEETRRVKYYERVKNSRSAWKDLRKLNFNKNVHSSDVDIADFKMRDYYEKHKHNITKQPLKKAFFDIEVDTFNYEGFPEEELAPCVIDFISMVDQDNKHLNLYVLINPENESQAEFIRNNNTSKQVIWTEKNTDWVADFLPDLIDPKRPDCRIETIKLQWFTKELSLIKTFLTEMNAGKFDIMGAWNAMFDIRTIEVRLRDHYGLVPADLFCPEEFPKANKVMNVIRDTYSVDIEDRCHTFDIEGWGHWVDLQYAFASIRKGQGKRDSLKLDDVLLNEIGESKHEYEGDIQTASRVNFEAFLRYSAFDSFRLMQLEAKNNDTDVLYDMSILTHTRFSKVMRKTVSIRNFISQFFWEKGFILSNNQNYFITHENLGKFEGALTLQEHVKVN